MNVNQLQPGELSILKALEDQRPRGTIELAKLTDLPGWAIKSMAAELSRRRAVSRRRDYRYEITQHGLEELARSRQLRIVQ